MGHLNHNPQDFVGILEESMGFLGILEELWWILRKSDGIGGIHAVAAVDGVDKVGGPPPLWRRYDPRPQPPHQHECAKDILLLAVQ